jgi:hypothetical protein
MSLTDTTAETTGRRERAASAVSRLTKAALIGALAAFIGWVVASAITGLAIIAAVAATVIVAVVAVVKDGKLPIVVWGGLAGVWAAIIAERVFVHSHGGFWVAASAWGAMVFSAWKAGSRWTLPLLAYPLIMAGGLIAADEPVLKPYGITWLWVPAVLVPLLIVRALLTEKKPADKHAT